MHFLYCSADSNAVLARRLYQERYPGRRCPDRKTFVSIHRPLCEHGSFVPRAANRGRPRSAAPEVEEDILDVVNVIPGITTWRVSMQVGVAHSTVWRALTEQQLYPYRLQHGTGLVTTRLPCTNNVLPVVQILTSLPLWYLRMKHSSQEMVPRIFTVSIRGQMKVHVRFFHHFTNSGSSSTSRTVFVVIIYSDLT
jgi:hypothetical protein